MDDTSFVWTALPPLPIRGLNSELVESIDYYLMRMSWVTGWPVRQITSFLQEGVPRKPFQGSLRFYRLDARSEMWLFALERLTGVAHLRHGTFWVMKDIFKARAIERPGLQPRRWCPLCYQHWDPEESWEPLLWSISGVFRCPVHKCVLISECTACGSGQASGVAIDRRRWCQKCGAGLSGDGTFVETPRFYEWIDAQICGLVTLCATAGRDPLSGNVLTQLTSKLIKRKLNKNRRHRRDIDTIRMCLGSTHGEQTVSGLSIKTLVNLSALHGASVVDMVMRPGEIMSKPLFDIWSGFHWLCDPFERKDGHVKAARWLLKRLLAHSGLLYLPTMRILTKDIGVSPSRLEAFDPETYGSYMDAYENQQCPSVRYARGRAFSVACKRLKDINPDRWRRNRLWWLPREVGKEAHVSEDDAFCACSSAIIYSRLLARAVKHTERSVAAKEDIRWIESSPVGADT